MAILDEALSCVMQSGAEQMKRLSFSKFRAHHDCARHLTRPTSLVEALRSSAQASQKAANLPVLARATLDAMGTINTTYIN